MIIDFFTIDYQLDRFLFFRSISIKIDRRIYKNRHHYVYLSSCECSTMDAANPPPSKIELHNVIKFLTKENYTPADIHRRLCAVYGAANVLSVRKVERWQGVFKEGRTNVKDKDSEGQPSDAIDKTIRCVRALLSEDRQLTITNLQVQMATQFSHEAGRGTIYTALTEHLALSKVCADWVPRQLTEDSRTLRMGWALEFLTQYHMKGNELIERIVTVHESWIHFCCLQNQLFGFMSDDLKVFEGKKTLFGTPFPTKTLYSILSSDAPFS